MSPAHKQRLVGAAVLVALFLIVVPIVLDFSRDEQSEMTGVDIPPGPEVMQMEVLPLDEWSRKVEPGVDDSRISTSDNAAESESSEPPQPEMVPETAATQVPPPSESVAASAPPVAATPKSTPKIEPQSATKPVEPAPAVANPVFARPAATANSGDWVVQVASLSVESKAIALRDRLRKAGYSAQVEKSSGGGAALYRVKAGPVASRDEAERLKSEIKRLTKLDGLVRKSR